MKRMKHFCTSANPHWSYHPLSWSDPKFRNPLSLDSFPLALPPFLKSNGQLDLQIILTLFTSQLYHCNVIQNIICHLDLYNSPPPASKLPCGLPTLHSAHMARWSFDEIRSGHSPAYNLPIATHYKEDKP